MASKKQPTRKPRTRKRAEHDTTKVRDIASAPAKPRDLPPYFHFRATIDGVHMALVLGADACPDPVLANVATVLEALVLGLERGDERFTDLARAARVVAARNCITIKVKHDPEDCYSTTTTADGGVVFTSDPSGTPGPNFPPFSVTLRPEHDDRIDVLRRMSAAIKREEQNGKRAGDEHPEERWIVPIAMIISGRPMTFGAPVSADSRTLHESMALEIRRVRRLARYDEENLLTAALVGFGVSRERAKSMLRKL
jgi:hypothetical protein